MPRTSLPTLPSERRRAHALRAAAVHLLISVAIAGVVALLVFGAWFPSPWRELVGGTELFWLIVGVDVVCGPLLTLVVFAPTKPRAELRRDLVFVAMVQLVALGYGVHTLSYARPVALVYEVDRFRVVTFADLEESEASTAPAWAQPWSLAPLHTVGLRPVATNQEKIASVDASLQGVEPSQRPGWWQDYSLSVSRVLQRAHPIVQLRTRHPDQTALLAAELARAVRDRQPGETRNPEALLWMPLVSRRATDWVVLLDPTSARPRGYIHADGF